MAVTVNLANISKHFATQTAVDNINLTVVAGELLSLLGPSGCGKTTVLGLIAGFHSLDQGDILFDGQSIRHQPVHQRQVGMVFQSYALFPHLTVFDNVAFALRQRGERKANYQHQVNDLLERIQLQDKATRYPRQLSGGQQQRVALARALIYRPKVLLLDEPLGALDHQLRQQMQQQLRDLRQQFGTTTLLVTHDHQEALSLSDRVAVMRHGAVLQVDTPRQLYHAPSSRFVAEFVGQTNILAGQVQSQHNGEVDIMLLNQSFVARGYASVGAKVHVALRHEQVHWGLAAQACHYQQPAQVLARYFAGHCWQYQVQLTDQQVIDTHRGLDEPTMAIGDSVLIGWHARDAIVVDDAQ